MIRHLPYDWTRCMGLGCPVRDECARFRDQPENTVLSWVQNMGPENHDSQGECMKFVRYDDSNER